MFVNKRQPKYVIDQIKMSTEEPVKVLKTKNCEATRERVCKFSRLLNYHLHEQMLTM